MARSSEEQQQQECAATATDALAADPPTEVDAGPLAPTAPPPKVAAPAASPPVARGARASDTAPTSSTTDGGEELYDARESLSTPGSVQLAAPAAVGDAADAPAEAGSSSVYVELVTLSAPLPGNEPDSAPPAVSHFKNLKFKPMAYEHWPGKNRFYLGGRIMTGPREDDNLRYAILVLRPVGPSL
ncbi:hypothetical protein T492DRAFT_838790 [Pavlovales sp. CCMP2436]|nr:hypothetical protein T492DRAFT_838790 [Pavlovales sp. CCMP2436]